LRPFAWSDVTLYGHGASELRVHLDLSPSNGSEQVAASMLLWDGTGQPVATVGSLKLRRTAVELVPEHHVEQVPAPTLLDIRESPALRATAAGSTAVSALRGRLTGLLESERLGTLVVLVQEEIAAVLALPGASSVQADVPLKE